MRLDTKALGITAALLWGGAVFVVAVANQIWPPYGQAFLDWIASFYPGYTPGPGAGPVVTATLYGIVDAGVGGVIFAWLYNRLATGGGNAAQ
jgi:hypothetical protein